jgi:superfamily II DNA/RNA helicase
MCEDPAAARRLSAIFAERGVSHQHISGRMPQDERNQQWADYSTNAAGVLIATRIRIKTLESVFRCLVVYCYMPRQLDEAISRACRDVVIGYADQSELDRIQALPYASAELTPLNKRQGDGISQYRMAHKSFLEQPAAREEKSQHRW